MSTLFDLPTPAPNQPPWVTAYQKITGTNTTLTTTAKPTPCPKCNTWTLHALDADFCATPIHLDPNPLTTHHEAAAILLGRPTYAIHGTYGHYQLNRRTPFHQTPYPLRTANQLLVLAQHHCNTPISTTPLPYPQPTQLPDGPPPF